MIKHTRNQQQIRRTSKDIRRLSIYSKNQGLSDQFSQVYVYTYNTILAIYYVFDFCILKILIGYCGRLQTSHKYKSPPSRQSDLWGPSSLSSKLASPIHYRCKKYQLQLSVLASGLQNVLFIRCSSGAHSDGWDDVVTGTITIYLHLSCKKEDEKGKNQHGRRQTSRQFSGQTRSL